MTFTLLFPHLTHFQYFEALLVYNDAIFSKTDFQSIQRIGDSLKRAEEESKAKIGRFGIGFNAVYHWTELPSFISLNYLVLLDPQVSGFVIILIYFHFVSPIFSVLCLLYCFMSYLII